MHHALIIERDIMQRSLLTEMLSNQLSYHADSYSDNHQAIKNQHEYNHKNPELIFLDASSCQPDHISAIEQFNRLYPDALLIITLNVDTLPLAARAITQGADQILTKPLNLEQLQNTLKQAKSDRYFKQHSNHKDDDFSYLVNNESNKQKITGNGKHHNALQEFITKSVQSTIPLIIKGEHGSGKTHLAKIIHQLSENCHQPFHIIEADKESKSLKKQLEHIINGTLYIKIRCNLNSTNNVIWNNYLSKKNNNIRIIVSDITTPIIVKPNSIKGYFTNTEHISFFTRPLRERREDILPIAHNFLEQSNKMLDKNIQHFSEDAVKKLKSNEWSGNIRQLRNMIFVAANNSANEIITERDLINCDIITSPQSSNEYINDYNKTKSNLDNGHINTLNNGGDIRTLKELEEEIVNYALEHYNGSRSRAARQLGIGRTTLYRKAQLLQNGNNEI